jgi:hypothetical protein
VLMLIKNLVILYSLCLYCKIISCSEKTVRVWDLTNECTCVQVGKINAGFNNAMTFLDGKVICSTSGSIEICQFQNI